MFVAMRDQDGTFELADLLAALGVFLFSMPVNRTVTGSSAMIAGSGSSPAKRGATRRPFTATEDRRNRSRGVRI